jgi:hypothetical protein
MRTRATPALTFVPGKTSSCSRGSASSSPPEWQSPCPGTVDAGYRGEIAVTLLNTDTTEAIELHRGDRIAQMVIQRVEYAQFIPVNDLSGSVRGTGGFGSTGGFKRPGA